jgi:hypothetical protein
LPAVAAALACDHVRLAAPAGETSISLIRLRMTATNRREPPIARPARVTNAPLATNVTPTIEAGDIESDSPAWSGLFVMFVTTVS